MSDGGQATIWNCLPTMRQPRATSYSAVVQVAELSVATVHRVVHADPEAAAGNPEKQFVATEWLGWVWSDRFVHRPC